MTPSEPKRTRHAKTLLDELFDQGGQAQSAQEGRLSMTRFGLIKHPRVLDKAHLIAAGQGVRARSLHQNLKADVASSVGAGVIGICGYCPLLPSQVGYARIVRNSTNFPHAMLAIQRFGDLACQRPSFAICYCVAHGEARAVAEASGTEAGKALEPGIRADDR